MSAAVTPTRSRFAASGKVRLLGLANTSLAGTVTVVADAPGTRNARTSSPTPPPPDASAVPGPSAATTPESSDPIRIGRRDGSVFHALEKALWSDGFMPAARTVIVT